MSSKSRLPVLAQPARAPKERPAQRPADARAPRPLIAILGNDAQASAFARALIEALAPAVRVALIVSRKVDARAFEACAGLHAILTLEDAAIVSGGSDALGEQLAALPIDARVLSIGDAVLAHYAPTFAISVGRAAAPRVAVRDQGMSAGVTPDLWLSDVSAPIARALAATLG